MNIVDRLFKIIIKGKEGRNIGISTGLDKVDKLTYGIQKEYITTIFGDSGSGKTTYALFTHVYKPLMAALSGKHKVAILYFSFEMSQEVLLAKLLCLYIYDHYNIRLSFKDILSLTKELNDEYFQIVSESKAWLESVIDLITIIDVPVIPDVINILIRKWCNKFGDFVDAADGTEFYMAKNPDQFRIILIDHIRLTKSVTTPKAAIDDTCNHLINARNICKCTIAIVQQANRQLKSMDRRNGGFQMLQLDDTSDSSGPVQASEIVIGLFHPHREKMAKIDGYDVKKLKDSLRVVQILKARYGESDINTCVNFLGDVGYFKEFPPADQIDYDDYIIEEITNNKDEEKNVIYTF